VGNKEKNGREIDTPMHGEDERKAMRGKREVEERRGKEDGRRRGKRRGRR
jgi:hypothetical protein